jgi:hypothetical protein
MGKEINLVEAKVKDFVEAIRPPENIRSQVDIEYTFENNTIELIEVRPSFRDKNQLVKHAFAKTKFVKTQQVWKIYWMRASGKWESYEPASEVKNIEEFFTVITEDKHGCFFG